MNSRLTPELLQSIIRMIDAGNYKKVAAAYCKISETTFYEWQELGKQEQKDGVEIVRVLSDEMLPGDLVFAFGKHEGERLRDCPSYLKWMARGDFSTEVKTVVRKVLMGAVKL